MPASAHEAVQARAYAVLVAAGPGAGTRVFRGRPDAFAPEEVPAINVRRGNSQFNAYGSRIDHTVIEFDLDHHVRGDDWETTSDALHMQSHAALLADAMLPTLCAGLRCIRTEPRADQGDQTLGRLTATYQAQALVRQVDLLKHQN